MPESPPNTLPPWLYAEPTEEPPPDRSAPWFYAEPPERRHRLDGYAALLSLPNGEHRLLSTVAGTASAAGYHAVEEIRRDPSLTGASISIVSASLEWAEPGAPW